MTGVQTCALPISLPVVEKFATAGMFDMALATDLATDAQSALGLTVKDSEQNMINMTHVTDVLVKANTLANATVEQFSTALTAKAGTAMKSYNIDLEEGVAVLAAYADQGIKAQLAGNMFGRMLRLTIKSINENREVWDKWGITVEDTEGNLVPIADIIQQITDRTKNMGAVQKAAALEMLGFQARSQQAILPLLGLSDNIREYEKNLRMAAGTTEEIANKLKRSYKAVQHRRAKIAKGLPIQYKVIIKPKDRDKEIISTLKKLLSNMKPYKASKQDKLDKKGDTLVIQLSDMHAGKIVKNQEGIIIYDEHIFRQRIDRLCKQILKLLDKNISKGVPIKEVVILSTGDQANGENIYATQAYEQELAPPKQVMLVVDVITKLIKSLLDRKLPVKFYGVKGNHGRTGKDTDPTANWDLMIYMILSYWSKFVLKNRKLEIKYAETDYLTCKIRGHNYMIRHKASEQADTPAGRVKINEWARRYDAEGIVYGHWHHFALLDVDNVRVFRGGSTVGGDSLSEQMAKHSEPIQLIWGVNEHRVSTFFYAVDLGEKK